MQPNKSVVLRLCCYCKIFSKECAVNEEIRIFASYLTHLCKNVAEEDTEMP